MADSKLIKEFILDTEKIYLNMSDIQGYEDKAFSKAIKLLNKNPKHNIYRIKSAVLIKNKAEHDRISIEGILEKYDIGELLNKKDISKLVALNQLILKYKESNIYNIFERLLVKSNYLDVTVQYNMQWLDTHGVLDELNESLDEIMDSGDFFGEIMQRTTKTKKCNKCGKEMRLNNFSIGKAQCKNCYALAVSKRKHGEDGERIFKEREVKKTVQDNIEEFKTESQEQENKVFKEYSAEFINIMSQIKTLNFNIDELIESEFNGLSCDETHEISILLVETHRKLLNMEEKLHERK